MSRLAKIPGTSCAQLTLTVVDEYQHLGVGSMMLQQLINMAQQEGIAYIDGYILVENKGMIKICKRAGFEKIPGKDPAIVHVRLTL